MVVAGASQEVGAGGFAPRGSAAPLARWPRPRPRFYPSRASPRCRGIALGTGFGFPRSESGRARPRLENFRRWPLKSVLSPPPRSAAHTTAGLRCGRWRDSGCRWAGGILVLSWGPAGSEAGEKRALVSVGGTGRMRLSFSQSARRWYLLRIQADLRGSAC